VQVSIPSWQGNKAVRLGAGNIHHQDEAVLPYLDCHLASPFVWSQRNHLFDGDHAGRLPFPGSLCWFFFHHAVTSSGGGLVSDPVSGLVFQIDIDPRLVGRVGLWVGGHRVFGESLVDRECVSVAAG
jgi:hypothetical protein